MLYYWFITIEANNHVRISTSVSITSSAFCTTWTQNNINTIYMIILLII